MLKNNIGNSLNTIEDFNELLKDYYFEFNDNTEKLLTDILKADIGGILDKTNPNPEQISLALFEITNIFRLIKALTHYANSLFVNSNPSCRYIIGLIQEINEHEIQDDVMRSFGIWIYDDNEIKAEVSYATELSKNFQVLISFIHECKQIGGILYNQKEDKSC
ncbi:MAG: hypothetical protein ACYCZO_10095 [Daejeonella sp.]